MLPTPAGRSSVGACIGSRMSELVGARPKYNMALSSMKPAAHACKYSFSREQGSLTRLLHTRVRSSNTAPLTQVLGRRCILTKSESVNQSNEVSDNTRRRSSVPSTTKPHEPLRRSRASRKPQRTRRSHEFASRTNSQDAVKKLIDRYANGRKNVSPKTLWRAFQSCKNCGLGDDAWALYTAAKEAVKSGAGSKTDAPWELSLYNAVLMAIQGDSKSGERALQVNDRHAL